MGREIILDAKQGLIYKEPEIPRENTILYYDLPKKDQCWRTPADKKNLLTIYDGPALRKMKERERVEHMHTWRMRGLDGMWFMNNGEPTYLPPMMVDHLCYNKFNGRHFLYNRNQRDDFLFRHLIWEMDDVDGMQWIKPRRYGMTFEEITQGIWVLLQGEHHNVALMSDTGDIAKKTLLFPLIDTYLSRPSWLREICWVPGGKRPRSKLELVANTVTDKDSEIVTLGGVVYPFATKDKGADSTENMYCIQDEFSKVASETNPRQMLEANKKTIRNAGRYGKISALSTTGDSDQMIQSVNEWIRLSGESILRPGLQKGTISGLVKRVVSAVWSQWLPRELLPDRYGEIDVARNTEWVVNEVNKKQKGTKEWYYEKRKLPLDEDDALIGAAGVSYFDKIRVVSRRKFLEGLAESEKPYVRGILWEDYAGRVHFKSDAERRAEAGSDFIERGNWMVAIHPYKSAERGIDTSNRWSKRNNVYFPPTNPEGCIGFDPTRYNKEDTTSNNLSRASIIVGKKFDYYGAGDANRYCALYVGRQDDPKDDHREAVKAAKYWGYPVMHERQVESVKEVFEECNCLPFLMLHDGDGKIHGIWTLPKTIKNGVDMLVTRFKAPKTPEEIDQLDEYPFEDGLIDIDNFDLANTTKFDVFMSMLVLEYGLKLIHYTNITDESINEMKSILQELVPSRAGSGRMV